jgi:hypothetical protein
MSLVGPGAVGATRPQVTQEASSDWEASLTLWKIHWSREQSRIVIGRGGHAGDGRAGQTVEI